MKLTKREINYLLSCGYRENDIDEINAVIDKKEIKCYVGKDFDILISLESAKNKLGWREWASGIGRCTYHASAMRCNKNTRCAVMFSYKWW